MAAEERHYSVPEVSSMWRMSRPLVRELFRAERGVIKIERPEKKGKRGYCTMLVSESSLRRVYDRLQGRAA